MSIKHWFKLADAYAFASSHDLGSEASAIRGASVHPSIGRPHVVRKGLFVELFQLRGVLDQFAAEHWPLRSTPAGDRTYQRYLAQKALNDQLLGGIAPSTDAREEVDALPESPAVDLVSFALEAQLRDFIAANLARIPVAGRRLTLFVGPDGRRGVEFPTDVGPIDILAKDECENLFVFELKLDRGPDRALGQLARYMGWVKQHLARGRGVSGIVVAKSIDERLRYAVCVIPNVALLEYEVDFRLRDVQVALELPPDNALEPLTRN